MTKIEILNKYKKQKHNTYRESDVINAMEKYLESYKKDQALQLQQTGVKSSVSIELKDWDYDCADGCCTTFGTKLLLNGKELEHPNEEILDNSYVGCDVQTALHAVLKELGYEVTFV